MHSVYGHKVYMYMYGEGWLVCGGFGGREGERLLIALFNTFTIVWSITHHDYTILSPSLPPLVSAPLLLASEETRLMESIDAINEKLKGRVISLDTMEHSDNKKVFYL